MARHATAQRGRRPPLGQHFLRDDAVRDAIVAALPDDGLPLIEVGPGRGALTEILAGGAHPLVAVELDAALATLLRRRLADRPRTVVLQADILDVPVREALAALGATPPAGVVGNLPYAIAAPLLRTLLSRDPDPPAWLVLMVQREVALQIVAPPGKRSLLSVSAQYYAQPELLFPVEPQAFDPPPRVRSAIVRVLRRATPPVAVPSEARFFEVVGAGFSAPRKQLHNALAQGLWLPSGSAREWLATCDIDPTRRAATLTLEEWARLAWALERSGAPPGPDTHEGERVRRPA